MSRQSYKRTNHQWKPVLESLEDRQLLAAHLFFIGNPALGYYLNLKGTQANDHVEISREADELHIDVTPGDTNQIQHYKFTDKMPAFIRFEGYAGNNEFINKTSIPCIVITGAGNDTIQGGSNRDFIMAGNGENKIQGGADNDLIIGGMQRDVIDAGAGDDVVFALNGNNVINGGDGNDYLEGGYQADWLFGSVGKDILIGLGNDDWLFGNDGDDSLFGGDNEDRLFGGTGNDALFGGFGYDRLYGGDDSDYLAGAYDLSLDWLDGGEGYNVAEHYVHLNNIPQDSVLWQLQNGALYIFSAGTLGESIFSPFHVDQGLTVPAQEDQAINTQNFNDVIPSYGKDPEFVLFKKVSRSAVTEASAWSDYVLALAGKVNLQGNGVEVPSRSSIRAIGGLDRLMQHQTLAGASSTTFSTTTQVMNIDLPPVEVPWTTSTDEMLNTTIDAATWLNPDDLLLAAILNNEGDVDTQYEMINLLDQGGFSNWSDSIEAADPVFTNYSNEFENLSMVQLSQELAKLDSSRLNLIQDTQMQHQVILGI